MIGVVEQSELDTEWTLVEDASSLVAAADRLAAGEGPVGVDAERASGFRYRQDAYLVQMYRRGSGTFLFDPVTLESFTPLEEAVGSVEWILHAASQDLPCLTAIGLIPERIFDTELAGRLLGFERVGLGALVESLLGIHLEKAHSADDWSKRPLPDSWLEYAALDVALLPDLRDAVEKELRAQGKQDIAAQEFEAELVRPSKPPHTEPWRRLSGGHRISDRRSQAIARELWLARDELARDRDVAPGRLIPDSSIIVAAKSLPRSSDELARLKTFRGRESRAELDRWWAAIMRGRTTEDLPGAPPRDPDSIPHHRSWPARHPEAAARLDRARTLVAEEADRLRMPTENLLTPDTLRRVAWRPPSDPTAEAIGGRLRELGAREWQIEATAPLIASAFVETA